MRTTLTLDPDVAHLIEEEVHRRRKPYKEVVNDAIRRGLAPRAAKRPAHAYKVVPHRSTLKPGLDARSLNRLADEVEDDAILLKRS
jgi:hypothetical protein